MVKTLTPVCAFDTPAIDFRLPDTAGKFWTLEECRGKNGLLVMFICNHCPFVKSILSDLATDTEKLKKVGINTVAIMSNDIEDYTEDSPEHMAQIAQQYHFSFPYLYDESQKVAQAYGAVCTPDFFGYNKDLKLQYRGRFDARQMNKPAPDSMHELLQAMQQVAETGKGPVEQTPSIGCSIKWKKNQAE
jgi:peroxiredoxin